MLKRYLALMVLGLNLSLMADSPAPYQFNVYAEQNIGTSSSSYGSDFEGIAGAGGSVYFSNFGLNANGTASASQPYSLFTGGNATINSSQINNGGIQAGGVINSTNTTVNGNVNGGGNLTGSGGQINGNATISGTNSSSITVSGTVSQNQPYSPSINLASVSSYFNAASSFWGGLSSTGTAVNNYGTLTISALTAGRNIVNLSYSSLSGVTGINISGAANDFLIFNITGIPAGSTLNAVTLNLSGGVTSNDVLFNLPSATSISLSGGTYASILATSAAVSFSSGVLAGNLIVQSLTGAGQVNLGQFAGFQADQNNFQVTAPEPSTYALLGSLLLVVAYKGRKLQLAKVKR